jgi:hypothetical protein
MAGAGALVFTGIGIWGTIMTDSLRRAAVSGALVLAVLAAAHGVARADDDENKDSIWNLDKKIMKDVMRGIGLRDGTEGTIDYRERSPLVIPSNKALPPPETAASQKAPNWPVDPNIKRRQEAAKRKDPRGYDPEYESRNMMPSELNAPGASRASRTSTSTTPGNNNAEVNENPVKPSELGYFGGVFTFKNLLGDNPDEVGTFTKEPPRQTLVDPPPGYQTPSPEQPYGLSKKVDNLTGYRPSTKVEDIPAGE